MMWLRKKGEYMVLSLKETPVIVNDGTRPMNQSEHGVKTVNTPIEPELFTDVLNATEQFGVQFPAGARALERVLSNQ